MSTFVFYSERLLGVAGKRLKRHHGHLGVSTYLTTLCYLSDLEGAALGSEELEVISESENISLPDLTAILQTLVKIGLLAEEESGYYCPQMREDKLKYLRKKENYSKASKERERERKQRVSRILPESEQNQSRTHTHTHSLSLFLDEDLDNDPLRFFDQIVIPDSIASAETVKALRAWLTHLKEHGKPYLSVSTVNVALKQWERQYQTSTLFINAIRISMSKNLKILVPPNEVVVLKKPSPSHVRQM